jgi:hypothetical protein
MKNELKSGRGWLVAGWLTLGAGLVSMAQTSPPHHGAQRPPNTGAPGAQVPADALQLFKDAGFHDESVAVDGVSKGVAGSLKELPKRLDGSLSSLRWNVPPGVIVVFYEDAAGKGETFSLWGQGQAESLGKWDFSDKASRWAWFNTGGEGVPDHLVGAPLNPPHGVEALATSLPENTIVFFKDKNFHGTEAEASSINAPPQGQLQGLPATLPDSVTSMRWHLGPGIVVMLFQDASGAKQQFAIWGKGQVADLDHWDFNDKVSRWAWFDIGLAMPRTGTVPPPANPHAAPGAGTAQP